MRIRLADTDDIADLSELVALASAELEQFGTPRMDQAVMTALVAGIRDGEAVVVAEQERRIVGFVGWAHMAHSLDGVCEGIGTYVRPECRKDGVSRDMRQFATEHARRLGYKAVMGSVALDNEGGCESARRAGFKPVGYLIRKEL